MGTTLHPPEHRAAVEALLRDSDLTMGAIAARLGLTRHEVGACNARAGGIRPRHATRRALAKWPAGRVAALSRLHAAPGVEPGDLAEIAGLARTSWPMLAATFGLGAGPPAGSRGRRLAASLDAGSASDAPTLRAHLRAHIARQIAAFDAALTGEGGAVLDTARVLRDLGGLKRLFDELVRDEGRGEGADGGEPGPSGVDLAALRVDIARRYDRFVGARAAA